jgi:hypothetical protein
MSTVYLLPDDPTLDAVGFDATTGENHDEASTVTENPIESGRSVVDHIIHEPRTFTCEVTVVERGIRSDFYGNASLQPNVVKIPNYLGYGVVLQSVVKVNALLWAPGKRVLEMQDRLTALRLAGATMTILTSTREYESMILTNVGMPRGPLEGNIGKFALSFRELVTVETATVAAPVPKEPRAVPTAAKGAQTSFFDELFQTDKSIALSGAQGLGWLK